MAPVVLRVLLKYESDDALGENPNELSCRIQPDAVCRTFSSSGDLGSIDLQSQLLGTVGRDRLPEMTKPFAEVFCEQVGLFHRRKVAPSRQLGPALNIEKALSPLAGWV